MIRILSLTLTLTLTVLSLSTGYSQDSSDRCFEVSQMLVKHNKDSLNVISNCDVLDFKIENTFKGIIEKGTPLAQVIPFKRESWNSQYIDYKDSKENQKTQRMLIRSKFFNYYKKNFWHKKEWH